MLRIFLSVVALLMVSSGANGALFSFTQNGQVSGDPITVLDNSFAIADMPNASGFKYPSLEPMSIQVESLSGPLMLNLSFVSTRPNKVTLAFEDAHMHIARMVFDVAGVGLGDPVPAFFADTTSVWSMVDHVDPEGGALGGVINAQAQVTAIPEPSAMALGMVVVGLVGIGRFVRRRMMKA